MGGSGSREDGASGGSHGGRESVKGEGLGWHFFLYLGVLKYRVRR